MKYISFCFNESSQGVHLYSALCQLFSHHVVCMHYKAYPQCHQMMCSTLLGGGWGTSSMTLIKWYYSIVVRCMCVGGATESW